MATTLLDLYQLAENNNIDVMSIDTSAAKRLSLVSECNGYYIGINPFMLETNVDEAMCLAHELGHCITGSFYNRYSVVDDRKRSERRADIFAYNLLINRDELKKQLKSGVRTVWELADYFNVTEPFMNEAVEYYQNIGIV